MLKGVLISNIKNIPHLFLLFLLLTLSIWVFVWGENIKELPVKTLEKGAIFWNYLLHQNDASRFLLLFLAGDPYHIGTSPLISSANHLTGFYMTETSVMNDFTHFRSMFLFYPPWKHQETGQKINVLSGRKENIGCKWIN